jgi:hypothetical protein
MKRRTVLSVALILAALAWQVQTPAQAIHEKSRVTVPSNTDQPNPCTGEIVHLEGENTVISETVEDASGGFHFRFHVFSHGSGLGLSSGIKYLFNEEFSSVFNSDDIEDPLSCRLEDSSTHQFLIVSQGNRANQKMEIKFHITINDNCDVTAFISDIRILCQG